MLETERLLIRQLQGNDLKQIYAFHSDDEVNKYLPYETWQNWDDAKHWFAKVQARRLDHTAEQYVIERREDTRIVGSCIAFAHDRENARMEFGYVLGREHWGKGYMLEAMQGFVPELTRVLSLKELAATVETENLASLKLLDKMGFVETSRELEDDCELIHLSLTC